LEKKKDHKEQKELKTLNIFKDFFNA